MSQAQQMFPVTRGASVYVTDPTDSVAEANSVLLNTALEHINSNRGSGGSGLTDKQEAWLNSQMAADLQKEADAKYSITTSVKSGSLSYWADQTDEADMVATIQVLVKFDSILVDASSTPSGWTKTDTGTYEKTITKSSGATATTFSYTIPNGDYKDLTVSGSSVAKNISVSYPAWYGFYGNKTTSEVNTAIKSLARITSKVSQTANLTSSLETKGYLWIVTHGSATATQLGSTILDAKVDTSITINGRTLTGYYLYCSTNSVSAGGSFDSTTLNISL